MALTVCKKCCLEWQADSGGEACPRCALGSAEAERDMLREALEWYPISTAPKDGTHILAWDGNQHFDHSPPTVVHWFEDGFYPSVSVLGNQPAYSATVWTKLYEPGVRAALKPAGGEEMTGIERIAAERRRQIGEEGWTPEHDAQHTTGELAQAAAYYCFPDYLTGHALIDLFTPTWSVYWAKREGFPIPTDRDLIKAGALIATELDRRAVQRERES